MKIFMYNISNRKYELNIIYKVYKNNYIGHHMHHANVSKANLYPILFISE